MPTANDPIRWVDRQGQQIGPETLDLVLQRVHAGQISPATLVWWEGAADWVPLWQVEGVNLPAPPGAMAPPHPAAAAPPPPPPPPAPQQHPAPPAEAPPLMAPPAEAPPLMAPPAEAPLLMAPPVAVAPPTFDVAEPQAGASWPIESGGYRAVEDSTVPGEVSAAIGGHLADLLSQLDPTDLARVEGYAQAIIESRGR